MCESARGHSSADHDAGFIGNVVQNGVSLASGSDSESFDQRLEQLPPVGSPGNHDVRGAASPPLPRL